jgi:hypothetical protein
MVVDGRKLATIGYRHDDGHVELILVEPESIFFAGPGNPPVPQLVGWLMRAYNVATKTDQIYEMRRFASFTNTPQPEVH